MRQRKAKRLGYHRAGVAHYWILDPINETLTVLQWTPKGYLVATVAERGDKLRAPPFEAVEVDVSEMDIARLHTIQTAKAPAKAATR